MNMIVATESASNHKLDYIDFMKGLGIIFVIMGHSGKSFWNLLYSFHMGLFFWISGYLLYQNNYNDFSSFVKKKIKTILLPLFLFWSISTALRFFDSIKQNTPFVFWNHVKGLLLGGHFLEISGNLPIWFLQTLFIVELLFWVEIYIFPGQVRIVLNICLILGSVFFQNLLPGRPIYMINVVPCALVYLWGGFIANKYLHNVKLSWIYGYIAIILGIYVQLDYPGKINQINSVWYYFESFCIILGIYIIARNIKNPTAFICSGGGELVHNGNT